MNNQELCETVREKRLIIRGFGIIGEYLLSVVKDKNICLDIAICDKNTKKSKKYTDVSFIGFDDAIHNRRDYVFLIASFYNRKMMTDELIEAGVDPNNIIYGVTDEAWQFYLETQSKRKSIPLKKIQFEIDISMHCDLDCNCCSQFGAVAKPEFVDIDGMERDFKRLGELFEGEAERIYLIGGEPLLNKDIIRCIEIARSSFPIGRIDIFTNGILLFSMNDEFWDACHKYDIGLIVTKYPTKIDYDRMKNLALKKDVNFEFFGTSEDFKYMTPLGLDVRGKQDVEESFALCPEANNCIKLREGKLYTCTRPAVIYKFNDYFGTDLLVSNEDSIDIYKAKDGQEILEYLSHPIPFCRYCDNKSHREARKWGHSKKVIEEWT